MTIFITGLLLMLFVWLIVISMPLIDDKIDDYKKMIAVSWVVFLGYVVMFSFIINYIR